MKWYDRRFAACFAAGSFAAPTPGANETLAEELDALRASNDALGTQVTALCDAKTALTEELVTAKRELADARDVLVAEVEVESFEDRQLRGRWWLLQSRTTRRRETRGKPKSFRWVMKGKLHILAFLIS